MKKKSNIMNCNKYIGIILIAIAFAASATMSHAKNEKVDKIYMFGFAASFNDSVVYFTDIQALDSGWVNSKSKFLANRSQYSYQLKNYLSEQGEEHRTCVTFYALKQKDIEKKYAQMKRKYTAKGSFDVKYISHDAFRFISSEPDELYGNDAPAKKTKAKKAKKKRNKSANKPQDN